MKILGKYRITYPGYNNTTQIKNLVSHDEYLSIVSRQNELIRLISSHDKKSDPAGLVSLQKELDKVSKAVKAELSAEFGDEFFTDKSPLWLSRESDGIMFLPVWQGGGIEVKLEKID